MREDGGPDGAPGVQINSTGFKRSLLDLLQSIHGVRIPTLASAIYPDGALNAPPRLDASASPRYSTMYKVYLHEAGQFLGRSK